MDVIAAQWIGIGVAVAAAIAAYRKAPAERRLTDAQAGDVANQAASRIIDQLQEEISRCNTYAETLKTECAAKVERLRQSSEEQIRALRADLVMEREHTERLETTVDRLQRELNEERRGRR